MKKDKKKSPSSYILGVLIIAAIVLLGIIIYLSVNLIHSRENTLQSQTEIQETSNRSQNLSSQQTEVQGPSQKSTVSDPAGPPKGGESAGPVPATITPTQAPVSTPAASVTVTPSAQPSPAATAVPSDTSEGTLSPTHGDSAFTDKTDDTLQAVLTKVEGLLPTGNGAWACYICDLSGNTDGALNDASMQAASLIKLYIMGAVYENFDSLSQQYGADTLNAYLQPMITVSDNDAANSLVRCLGNGDANAGMQKVNAFCQAHGYTNTSMGRLLLASNEFGDNYTSVRDCGRFLKEIYQICNGTATNGTLSHAADMYALLKQQQRTNKIPAAMPAGVHVANKTGELSNVENDAGIIYDTAKGKDLVICFMSQNLNDTAAAQNTIAQVSRTIYSYYNE